MFAYAKQRVEIVIRNAALSLALTIQDGSKSNKSILQWIHSPSTQTTTTTVESSQRKAKEDDDEMIMAQKKQSEEEGCTPSITMETLLSKQCAALMDPHKEMSKNPHATAATSAPHHHVSRGPSVKTLPAPVVTRSKCRKSSDITPNLKMPSCTGQFIQISKKMKTKLGRPTNPIVMNGNIVTTNMSKQKQVGNTTNSNLISGINTANMSKIKEKVENTTNSKVINGNNATIINMQKIRDDISNIKCDVCGKLDDDANMLLCYLCDRGCHTYCLRIPLQTIPEEEWFCDTCKLSNFPPKEKKTTAVAISKQPLTSMSGGEENAAAVGAVKPDTTSKPTKCHRHVDV